MSAGRDGLVQEPEYVPSLFTVAFTSRFPNPGGRNDHPPTLPHAFPPSEDEGGHLGLSVWKDPSGYGTFRFCDVKGYRITAGLPRATSLNLPAFHKEFAAACGYDGKKPLHFGLTESALEFLPDLPNGMPRARWHVGDLPVFDLARWREDAMIPALIRSQTRRARNHGVTIAHWRAWPVDLLRRDALCTARDEWLRAKPLPPLVFLTTPFLFDPWPQDGVFVAQARGRIVGFLVGSRVLFGNVYRIDAVARVPGAPNGTAELLVREAFRDVADRGFHRATLGLAPLSRRSKIKVGGWLGVVTGCARRFGGSLYSFAGLEAFKAKFEPDAWVPLYAVAPGARFTPRDLLAVARVFVGGSIFRYTWRALRWKVGTRSKS